MNTQSNTHIIKRQVLDIRLQSQENAFQIQNQIGALYNAKIQTLIEEAFSSMAGPDVFMKFDKLEIDLGTISLANLESEFMENVQKILKKELLEKIHQLQLSRFTDESVGMTDLVSSSVTQPEDRIISGKEFELELLRHFLKTGLFPWWAQKHQVEAPENIFLNLSKTSLDGIRLFPGDEMKNETCRRRLIYQFSDQSLIKMTGYMISERFGFIIDWIEDFYNIFKQAKLAGLPDQDLRFIFWDALIKTSLSIPKQRIVEKNILKLIIESLCRWLNLSYDILIASLHSLIDQSSHVRLAYRSSLPKLFNTLKNELRPENVNVDSFAKGDKCIPLKLPDSLEQAEPKLSVIDQKSLLSPNKQCQIDDEDVVCEVYLENAGLALIWPYFSNYFNNIGLLQRGKFLDENSIIRAIHLIQYLATGEQGTSEYFLTLNKLLCGLDITRPVCKDFVVSDLEKNESEKLLKAVISHWSALKNTSVKGFKSSFLQRNGVLVKKENCWLLKVERKTFDILLERIPWSFSIIKLSWMETVLYVEW